MRTRAFVSLALLTLPVVAGAQLRRPSTRTPIEPASLPPAAPEVARDLALKRSRWAFEGYSLFSAVQVPSAGGTTLSSVLGGGTHGDYRLTETIAATADITYANLSNTNMSYGSAEAGARFLLPIRDVNTQPFVDVRGTYLNLTDMYFEEAATGRITGSPSTRYSHGFGGFAGVGVQHAFTGSFLLTTELSALRNRMTSYHGSSFNVPVGQQYWSTTYRFTIGVRYNAQRSLSLAQNPRQ